MDIGLLILRVAFGALLIGHGAQKLFGWFGGHGLDGTGGFFHALGFRPGRQMVAVAGGTEAVAGLFLIFGLFSPLAGAAAVGTMLVAASVHADKGLWGVNGGYELPLLYGVAASAVAIGGAGSMSLDNLLGLDEVWSAPLALAAVVGGLLAGVAMVARARNVLGREADSVPVASSETTASAA